MVRRLWDYTIDQVSLYVPLYIPKREEGQGMAEYGLILAGVSILAIVAVFLLGGKLGGLMNKINSSLS